MTGRYEYQPLRTCPPERLAALRAQVAALLRFAELLPADLYVKLDLLRDDISAVISPPPVPRAPAFTPHPQRRAAGPARQLPTPSQRLPGR